MRSVLRVTQVVCSLLGLSGVQGCHPVKSYRLNPDIEPPEFRIVCGNNSAVCRSEAAKLCDSEYDVVSKASNFAEPDPDAPAVSQAPTTPGEWRGELHVRCAGGPPPLSLKRRPDLALPSSAEAQEPVSEPSSPAAPLPQAPLAETTPRVCVPGSTQACLGPGACSGAQSCALDGAAFLPCDCGPPVPSAPASTGAP